MEKKRNILPLIAVFVVTAAIASLAIWFFMNRSDSGSLEDPSSDVVPTEVMSPPTEAPTPTPTLAEISKKIKIQILNATDINGQAATLKSQLVKMGFTNVTVGNATSTATENSLQIKPEVEGADAYFSQKLAGFYDVVPSMDLKTSSTYDAVFVIGSKLGEVPTISAMTQEETVSPTSSASAKTTPTPTEVL